MIVVGFILLYGLLATANVVPYADMINVDDRCTTIIVGKDAGTEGPMVTHTVGFQRGFKHIFVTLI